jgi:hypothetical protein
MADTTAIEWIDTTWNPVTGCTKVSAGCDNCYAERFSERFRGVKGHPFERGFDSTLRPKRVVQPLEWKRPCMIFVNSMSDLFQGNSEGLCLHRVRYDGESGLAHLSGADQAQFAHAEIHQRSVQDAAGTAPHVVWCFGRE